jgi:hypothetical protein
MSMKRRAMLGTLLVPWLAGAAEGEAERLRWRLVPEGWGVASEPDIRAVLGSAMAELWRFFPERKLEPFVVRRGHENPIVHYARSGLGEIVMQLNTQDRFWCQYAYQLAHEFCHILCGFEDDYKGNQWFEESLCECASLYVLRHMAVAWARHPPFPGWREYAPNFRTYADDVMKKFEDVPDAGIAGYVKRHRAELTKNASDRARNGPVAVALLRQLEAAPQYWEAVSWLNSAPSPEGETTEEYFLKWLRASPERVRPFVEQTGRLVGVVRR